MRLTARDVQVILAVRDHRALRIDQIERLFFPSRNTTNYRLQRLYQHGFLERRWRAVEYGRGMGQAIYLLGKRGAELAAQKQGGHTQTPGRRGVSHTVHSPFLEHALLVNDVRIALSLGAQKAGYAAERWVREDELRVAREYVYSSTASGPQRQVAIIPDAYAVLNLGDRRAHFLLEVDRATETSGRWAQRVRAYLAYIASGQYARRFGTTSLRILVITTSPERLANLKCATERVDGRSLFWFTILDMAKPETILTEPIWQVAGQERVSALVPSSLHGQQTGKLEILSPSI
jgi:hypothetical protein